ncbi:MAG TPA: ABC transporter permease, partial [Blastocatellia bacterium]|nr:ABC transporter permease [Blastocatellia bacterium]
NAVLLHPLPYPDPSRLTLIREDFKLYGGERSVSYPNFIDWREQNKVFTELAAYYQQSLSLTGGGAPERIRVGRVSASLFSALGVSPLLGRGFHKDEEQADRNRVMVVSENLWRRRFGGDPSVIGKDFKLDGATYTVVGVMPGAFSFPPQTELWIPLSIDNNPSRRGQRFLSVVGRLKPGISIAQAQAEMEEIASRLSEQYPDTNTRVSVALHPLSQEAGKDLRPALMIFLTAAGIMLLLTCVNASNLLLARAFIKSRVAAGNAATSAKSSNFSSRLVIDILALYAVSVTTGMALAYYGGKRLLAGFPSNLANFTGVQQGASFDPLILGKAIGAQQGVSFDPRVLGFALGISFVAMIICGLTPVIKAFSLDHHARLGVFVEPGKSVLRWFHLSLGALATIFQLALAMILIIGAGLLFTSFLRLRAVDAGFRTDHALTARIALPRYKYIENAQVIAFYQQIVERFAALPGVEAAGAVDYLPLAGGSSQIIFAIEGRPTPPNPIYGDYAVTTTNYFRAMSIPLLAGRYFTDQDSTTAPAVALVDASFKRRFFPNEDPIGKRLSLGADNGAGPWQVIIGVVGDVKQSELEGVSKGQIYLPAQQQPRANMTLVARTAVDPMLLASAMQKEVHTLDEELPVFQIRTMNQVLDESLAPRRLSLLCLATFALLALAQAAIGVYAFAACLTTGASRYSIGRLAMTGMIIIIPGVVVGLLGAFALTRLLSGLLYGVSATDPTIFLAGLVSVAGAALIACGVAILAQYRRSISGKGMIPSEGLVR